MNRDMEDSAHLVIGHWLKAKREKAGLSRSRLGAKIRRSPMYIARYESGRPLPLPTFITAAKAVGAYPHEIIEFLARKPAMGSVDHSPTIPE